ncbi:hypothetical protein L1987_30294 [Smallanthus sonchifolius]|uniref:Uncharacterized protein n=1 Tax=Smallanthus sonchifolius TaxID=185202 RepID=A0ACB9I1T4_9ASTR|nr:hypothetical protein L1987_30294 [Smallanthus sonchifolius]
MMTLNLGGVTYALSEMLPDSDLQKIVSLGIDRNNENDSATRLIEALKLKGFTGFDRKQALVNIPLNNELNDKLGEFVINVIRRKLEDLLSEESTEKVKMKKDQNSLGMKINKIARTYYTFCTFNENSEVSVLPAAKLTLLSLLLMLTENEKGNELLQR